jgi:hypothetical protein
LRFPKIAKKWPAQICPPNIDLPIPKHVIPNALLSKKESDRSRIERRPNRIESNESINRINRSQWDTAAAVQGSKN